MLKFCFKSKTSKINKKNSKLCMQNKNLISIDYSFSLFFFFFLVSIFLFPFISPFHSDIFSSGSSFCKILPSSFLFWTRSIFTFSPYIWISSICFQSGAPLDVFSHSVVACLVIFLPPIWIYFLLFFLSMSYLILEKVYVISTCTPGLYKYIFLLYLWKKSSIGKPSNDIKLE